MNCDHAIASCGSRIRSIRLSLVSGHWLMRVRIPGKNQTNQSQHYGRKPIKTLRSTRFHTAASETFQKNCGKSRGGGANKDSVRSENARVGTGFTTVVRELTCANQLGAFSERWQLLCLFRRCLQETEKRLIMMFAAHGESSRAKSSMDIASGDN